MPIQTIAFATANGSSTSRRISLFAIAFIAVVLSACAPVQQGNDQCKDLNVNLIELKDAKYKTLPVAEGGLSDELRAQIDDKVLEFMASKEVPIAGCAIAITRNNQIAYLQGYGMADEAANRPFTIATPSAIGSISKTLTALGLMALVEEGKLDLDTPLLNQMGLVPGVDVGWTGNPTLRQVLAHKGGFKAGAPAWNAAAFDDGPSMSAAFPNIPFPSLQPLLVFQGYKSEAGNESPAQIGTPRYSNVGYCVAGSLLDYRSKMGDIPAHMQGYERYVWYRVGRGSSATEPTMISASLATDFRTSDIKNLAHGYDVDGSSLNFGDSTNDGWGWEGPPGGWVLTIGDLARLMLILQSDAVISKATIDSQMRQNNGVLFGDGTRAGLGLELAGDSSWFGKGGDILGYTADFKIWPSNIGTDWGVAFICNQRFSGKRLTSQLHDLLSTTPGGSSGGEDGQAHDVRDPMVELARQYEPLVRQFAGRYLSQQGTPEEAWSRAKQELATYPNGKRLVSLLERGDLAGALRLLPTVVPAD
ncbi:MAG TPA: serine hydrolase domain-containing protein [Blastocatellia bacterium]|nr:serine hydrolase domain-containing protein [Blastocatellia bacterium]